MDFDEPMKWMVDANRAYRACAGVPTDALTPGRMAKLIRREADFRDALADVAVLLRQRGCAKTGPNEEASLSRAFALLSGEAS